MPRKRKNVKGRRRLVAHHEAQATDSVDRPNEEHSSQKESGAEPKNETARGPEVEDLNDRQPENNTPLQGGIQMAAVNKMPSASTKPAHLHLDDFPLLQDVRRESVNDQSQNREAAVRQRPQQLPTTFKRHDDEFPSLQYPSPEFVSDQSQNTGATVRQYSQQLPTTFKRHEDVFPPLQYACSESVSGQSQNREAAVRQYPQQLPTTFKRHEDVFPPLQYACSESVSGQSQNRGAAVRQHPQKLPTTFKRHEDEFPPLQYARSKYVSGQLQNREAAVRQHSQQLPTTFKRHDDEFPSLQYSASDQSRHREAAVRQHPKQLQTAFKRHDDEFPPLLYARSESVSDQSRNQEAAISHRPQLLPESFKKNDDEFPPVQNVHRESVNDQSRNRDAAIRQRPQMLPPTFKKQFPPACSKVGEIQHSFGDLSLLDKDCRSESVKQQPRDFHQMHPSTSAVNTDNPVISTACHSESSRAAIATITKRPNFGIQGKGIQLISNYFLLKGKGNYVYHYNVEIESPADKKGKVKTIKEAKQSGDSHLEIQQKRNVGKEKYRQVISQLLGDSRFRGCYPFYDGLSNLYTFRELPVRTKCSVSVEVLDGTNRKTYTVTIKPVNKNGYGNVINLESLTGVCAGHNREIPYEAIMTLDTLLSHRNPPFLQAAVGRSFFVLNQAGKIKMEDQLEIWKGYNQSVHLTHKGPAVLVNVSTKVFHSGGSVIEHAKQVLRLDVTRRELGPQQVQILSRSLRDVKVQVTHLPYPRRFTVASVTSKCAQEVIVNINNKDISVAQYFAAKYKPLRFPRLPCLTMRSGRRATYIPMEFCEIPPGQPKLGQLNVKQSSQMINKTAIPPSDRFRSIIDYADAITRISGPYIQQSGYKMELSPLNVTGRIISPPALAYGNKPSVKPDNRGVWRIDGKSFCKAFPNSRWMLISFAPQETCSKEILDRLSMVIVQTSQHVGLHLSLPLNVWPAGRETRTYDALHYAKTQNVQFVLVVLSRSDKFHFYDEVKFIADIKLGLITQCMEVRVALECYKAPVGGQIINNLLSKLNIKLGGTNHTFSQQPTIPMKRTIVMGADAAHSVRGSKCPSIAAVVGSIDDVPFQYAVSCRVQKNPDQTKLSQEIILGMKEMTKDILTRYREINPCFPEKIVFFRDGVSEGQFETALREELSLIQKACYEVCKQVLPVTFIVVQKRHQTRFMPQNPKEGIGRNGNVPPGTAVDSDVTHPVFFDYFLCSHEGIKGTSKPAHYVVLHDDNRFQADDLQKFCYDLCHVYARCNRSISIPAPAMNAHLAAARAKKYIEWCISEANRSGTGYADGVLQGAVELVNKVSLIKAPMFFV